MEILSNVKHVFAPPTMAAASSVGSPRSSRAASGSSTDSRAEQTDPGQNEQGYIVDASSSSAAANVDDTEEMTKAKATANDDVFMMM